MKPIQSCSKGAFILLFMYVFSPTTTADVVTKWNGSALEIITDANLKTAYANRALALVHTSIYVACNAITKRYQSGDFTIPADSDASIDAAIAAASYHVLLALLPEKTKHIDRVYRQAINKVEQGPAKTNGLVVGQNAAHRVLELRKVDPLGLTDTYKPHTSAGVYVPTTLPAVSYWGLRKPWFLTSADQFRATPPPDLTSQEWARDFNEVKSLGALESETRTQEQTDIAKFWQATLPPIYHGVIRSVAEQPGRDITQNARLFAVATRAIDDALIAVFDGKYYFQFWRPITAIRNAEIDGNPDTQTDESWMPLIPTPMHPEYPCAHCVVASTLGHVLTADVGDNPVPMLITSSTTANGAQRSWLTINDFVQEVSNARIYDGVHYRFSAQAANKMGKQIGELAVQTYFLKQN